MKIKSFNGNAEFYASRRQALRELMTFRELRDGRPCPGCAEVCPKCGSTSCLCTCSAECQQAPRSLSSDPERFPIESGIVPLVYALSDMEIGVPCWSCEGHEDRDGKLGKLPQVWFYVLDQAYPDLLANFLWQLQFAGHIENRWKVAVVAADNTLDATFAIVPDSSEDLGGLASLRRDIEVIGRRMYADVAALARKNIAAIDRLPASGGTPGGRK